MHMTAVIEVGDETGAAAAAGVATACIGLWCPGSDGFVELSRAASLARAAGTRPTLLLLSEPRRLDDLRALAGAIDAAVVGDALLDAADPVALIAAFGA
jgi:hypothetical protein